MRQLVAQAIEDARGGGFILCPTSGFMERDTADPQRVANYLAYVEAGLEYERDFS